MQQRVIATSDGHRVAGCGSDGELVNGFLSHLVARAFSAATVRAYAYDLLDVLRVLAERGAGFVRVRWHRGGWHGHPGAGGAAFQRSGSQAARPARARRRGPAPGWR